MKVSVEFAEDKIIVTIVDNGKGFQIPKALGEMSRLGKLGLIGMEERVRLLGGQLMVKSKIGIGTTVTVVVPV